MKERRIEKRAGFSLVELLIVIGVIAILVGGVGLSIALLRSTDTKSAAYEINSSLTDLKSRTTGGEKQPYLYLYCLNNTYYLDMKNVEPDAYTPTTEAKEIGDTRLKIAYGAGKTAVQDAPDGFLCLALRKKDGAFLDEGKCVCPEKITIEDNKFSYVVHLVKDTGRHYVEEK